MFESIFLKGYSVWQIVLMAAVSVVNGVIAAYIVSFKLRANKGVFLTVALLPAIVATGFCFLNVMLQKSSTSAITGVAAAMVGLGLLRFRSAPAKAEEMLVLLLSVVTGALCGLGYLFYAVAVSVLFPLIYVLLSSLDVFKNKKFSGEKLLKITVPESLEYFGAFKDSFARYLKDHEQVGIKTTGMGSMYLLSFRVVMKNAAEEKEFIDELRVKNGNLEISMLPFSTDPKEL